MAQLPGTPLFALSNKSFFAFDIEDSQDNTYNLPQKPLISNCFNSDMMPLPIDTSTETFYKTPEVFKDNWKFALQDFTDSLTSKIKALIQSFSDGSNVSLNSILPLLSELNNIIKEYKENGYILNSPIDETRISGDFLDSLKSQFEEIAGIKLSECFEDAWDSIIKYIRRIKSENQMLKSKLEASKITLKNLNKQLKSLDDIIALNDMPESPKQLNLQGFAKPPLRTTFNPPKLKPSKNKDLNLLNIELLQLETQLKQSHSNPPQILSKILSTKTKISDLRTQKVINSSQKLSQKVKKSLEIIEKSWVANEITAASSQREHSCYSRATSRGNSPLSFANHSRPISPLISRIQDLSSISKSPQALEEETFQLNQLKAKEEALDLITSSRDYQENQLKKIIAEYKNKLLDLEEEKNYILRLKAKTFAAVKKLKRREEGMDEKERRIEWEKAGEAEIVEVCKEKQLIREAQAKITQEHQNIYDEKLKISKAKTLLNHKQKAIKLIWPEIQSLLTSYKDLPQ